MTSPPPGRETVLVVSLSDLASDPRVSRQIRFLKDRYRVIAAGLNAPGTDGVEFIPLVHRPERPPQKLLGAARLLTRCYESYYWNKSWVNESRERLTRVRADLVVANDIDTLPLALRLGARAGVLFDAHEYAPCEFEDLWTWRLFYQGYKAHLCRRYIPSAAGMMTVCKAIAEAYERDTGARPAVVTNAPDYHDQAPGPLADGGRRVRLVHHGVAVPSRKIENMVRLMEYLDDRFEFDFLLVGPDPAYIETLKRLAGARPKVRFLPPVPMPELPRFLNRYDVGVFLLEPANFNYRYALPNKFFEFVQARLALAVGPSPEMARLVRQHDLGVVADDFSPRELGRALNALDATKLAYYKRRSHDVARELSAEHNRDVLLDLVRRLLAR